MPEVTLRGELLCATDEDVALVQQHLPLHIELTRLERGCLAFEVHQSDDPLVWTVSERFTDAVAFAAHQARVAASEWGRATAGIERRYVIEGLGAADSGTDSSV